MLLTNKAVLWFSCIIYVDFIVIKSPVVVFLLVKSLGNVGINTVLLSTRLKCFVNRRLFTQRHKILITILLCFESL